MDFKVTEIQRFCMHDGPGARTTVFFAGCPIRCAWCHNPETQSTNPKILLWQSKCIGCGACVSVCQSGAQIIGEKREIDRDKCTSCGACAHSCPTGALESSFKIISEDEIVREVLKDRAFFGARGGVTLSGGEPTLHGEKLLSLLERFKALGINTALETCGYFDSKYADALSERVDTFLWDIKDTVDARHVQYTGVSNARIIENLRLVDSLGAKSVMRCIMVRGVNMDGAHIDGIAALWHSLKNCEYVELLPYHTYGGSKAEALGLSDNGRRDWIPSNEDMLAVKELLTALGVKVK